MPAISSTMADDRDRFERIFRENFRPVLRFAAARTDPDRAKDVAAETFLVAWRRLEDVPDEPRPWLLGVARKVLAGQYRSESRRAALAGRLRARTPGGDAADLAGAWPSATPCSPPSPPSPPCASATASSCGSSRGTA